MARIMEITCMERGRERERDGCPLRQTSMRLLDFHVVGPFYDDLDINNST
jgi:hypothetical protein